MLKYLVLLGDGMADFSLPELDGQTPLEVAFTPSMDEVARTGASGLLCPIPEGMPPGSDIGNLTLFGYDPRETYTGRAPFEAANQGITLAPSQVAFRCNLVTVQDGIMKDFTAGHITTAEAAALVKALNENLKHFPVYFSAGVSYRHLTIMTVASDTVEDLARVACTPPHDISDKPCANYLPSGSGSAMINDLMGASVPVLSDHPVNAARVAAGKPPATSIWLWGQGRPPRIQTFRERFGLTGAVISAVDLVNGIGVCAGLQVIKVPGATGYLDTNYRGKVAAALEALRRVDFVYLHVEAPDETSHQGRIDLKIRAIEHFDAHVVAPCLDHMRSHPHFRLLVAPDHVTAISTRTHAPGPVPFALCGEGVVPNGGLTFSERAAHDTGILLTQGHTLLPLMLTAPKIEFPTLNHPRG
jgi:2,3-bisphosphoglycerate-independent phosphoglycerate mutase